MAKRNFLSKTVLKYTDRAGYKLYKRELAEMMTREFAISLKSKMQLSNLPAIKNFAVEHGRLNFNHSGNSGDIIYALPTLKKIHELTGVPVNLFFKLHQPMQSFVGKTHPLGNVMLNEKMVGMLIPLVASQPYINTCQINTGQQIDIDLDYFRKGLIPLDKGNIAHWCGYITGVSPVLWKNWINVEPDNSYQNTIIVARSERYRNELADYSFLQGFENVKFIGVKSEFEDIKRVVPNIDWAQVPDFLAMAKMIAGCKLFIGNQSFPYSIAEALKVKRILEVSLEIINVVPEGENGYDFVFQDHFENLVKELSTS